MSLPIKIGLIIIFLIASPVLAAGNAHADPVAPMLLALIAILAVAKIGGEIFERLGQPAVLGELLGGVLLGNLILLNPAWNFFEPLRLHVMQENWAVVIDSLAWIGVIILLFEVGLESTVQGMMKVGASSLLVAVLGIAAGLTIAAIISKQICGLGVLEKGYDRLSVGVGMIPRGEVGLIFAGIGKSLNVVNDAMLSAIAIMVIVTTLITPPVLKFTLARGEAKIKNRR
jgi:Kef-type K+ transport system membrane component KefB